MVAWLMFAAELAAACAVGAEASIDTSLDRPERVEPCGPFRAPTDAERHAVMLPPGIDLHTDWHDSAIFIASDGAIVATVRRGADCWIADFDGRPRVLRTFLYAPCEAAIRAAIIQCDLWCLRRRAGIEAWADPTEAKL